MLEVEQEQIYRKQIARQLRIQ